MDDETITLEIEEEVIQCSKKLLSSHSDYFKIMFEGDFVERNKSVIKLHDIDLKSMNIILRLFWDDTYVIEDEDILLVLHTACVLQFNHIKYICIETITERLNHENCLKIWLSTEQLDIAPLYLKAKNLALMEFNIIKDMDFILDLNLQQIKSYLANIYLNCSNEMDVFMTAIRWYYEKQSENDSSDILFDILSCISFNSLSDSDIHEIISYPNISNNVTLLNVLNCLLDIRHSKELINYQEDITKRAFIFHNTKRRHQPQLLCFMADTLDNKERAQVVRSKDKYNRKRFFVSCITMKGNRHSNLKENLPPKTIIYYDNRKKRYTKFFTVPDEKCVNLVGYSIVSYKELIFLLGGEMCIGRGNWNFNVWAYDTIRERWERKTKIPSGRRHFNCCVVDDILFIIGGTGNFRVLQENMLYYSYKEEKWSNEILLPCRGRQVKCCEFKKQLFLLNINENLAYIYNINSSQWTTYQIPANVLNTIATDKFSLFSYQDFIYIKGSTLVKMNCIGSNLNVISINNINLIKCDKIQSVVCHNILYTLYTNTMDNQRLTYTLESFNIDNYEYNFLFENMVNTTIEIDGSCYKFSDITQLVAFQHYDLLVTDTFV